LQWNNELNRIKNQSQNKNKEKQQTKNKSKGTNKSNERDGERRRENPLQKMQFLFDFFERIFLRAVFGSVENL